MKFPDFPTLAPEKMAQALGLPEEDGRLRVVIDTDTHNEIDDQFALAWAFLSQDRLEIEGVYAEPYSFAHHRQPLLEAYGELAGDGHAPTETIAVVGNYHRWAKNMLEAGVNPNEIQFVSPAEGMALSYEEILRVFEKLDEDPSGRVFRGSPGYLPAPDQPHHSEAVDHLIERAMANDDRPLYVVAIGAVTNIASALLLEPRIIEKIVVVWTSSYPSYAPFSNRPSLNLMQDLPASRLIFDSGVPHVYLPGFYIGEQLKLSLPDMEAWVKGQGKIGDYLFELYVNNPIQKQRGILDHFGRTWVIWDVINIAWLLNPEWVPTRLVPAPSLDDDMYWVHGDGRHLMREAVGCNRDAIFRDFLTKLKKAP